MAFVPFSAQMVFDQRGIPAAGARFYVYDAGTTTPRPVYTTAELSEFKRHNFPVLASGEGRLPSMWVGIGDYDVSIRDDNGAEIVSILGLPGDAPPSTGAGTAFDPLRQLPTGALVPIYGRGRRAGYVRPNGLTIGSGASDATERNDDDCHDLFVWLWDEDTSLLVTGGRGQNAEDDWRSGKTLTLPDYQNMFLAAVADMGNPALSSGRFTGGLLDAGVTADMLGGSGGEAAHALRSDENARHKHTATFTGEAVAPHIHTGRADDISVEHDHAIRVGGLNVQTGGAPILYILDGNQGDQALSPTNKSQIRHGHSLTVDQAGGHTPAGAVSVSEDGDGQAHNTLPPFRLCSLYLKL